MKKALVLYSGGLDSRLAVRILKSQGFNVTALYFALPFGCGCCRVSCNFGFTQKEGVKLDILDVTKGKLFEEYLNILKNPKFGRGVSFNPCKDCKIFMFKKAKEYASKKGIEVIATGEVVGQRPMSQIKRAMKKIDTEIGFEILRPLSAKLLPKTCYEKKGLVKREDLYDFKGRNRKGQMKLAEDFGIKYPNPGGGCFLCEKAHYKRLKVLLERNLINEKTLHLTMIGRHFIIDNSWFIVARNESECIVLDKLKNIVIGGPGKPTVYFHDDKKEKAIKLQNAYSKGANEKIKLEMEKYKL